MGAARGARRLNEAGGTLNQRLALVLPMGPYGRAMKRIHSALVAVLLGASSNVSGAQVQARAMRLDRFERQIKTLEARRPPALPALPAKTLAPPPPRLVAPAASVLLSSSRGDDESEHEDHEDDD